MPVYTLCRPMEFSIKLVQSNLDGPLYILKGHRLKFPNILFLSLKINFVLVDNADFDQMPHSVAYHLVLHCLQNYLFKGFQSRRIKMSFPKCAKD